MKIWQRTIFGILIFLTAFGRKIRGEKRVRTRFLSESVGPMKPIDEALYVVNAKLEKRKLDLFELRGKIHSAHGELKGGIIEVAQKLRDLNLDASRQSFDLWDQASDLDVNMGKPKSEPSI